MYTIEGPFTWPHGSERFGVTLESSCIEKYLNIQLDTFLLCFQMHKSVLHRSITICLASNQF